MTFDLLIRHGLVIDGSGGPRRRADVGVVGDRIEAVEDLSAASAAHVLDATGKVVCPGFIDPHVHSEIDLLQGQHTAAIQMGVTTELLAPDGLSYAPLAPALLAGYRHYNKGLYGDPDIGWDWRTLPEYLARFPGVSHNNVVAQVPHGTVRLEVMGWAARTATDAELGQMADLTRQCMEQGAVGLCNGLDYVPMMYADTRELIALSHVLAEFGGVYASHMRSYGDKLHESTAEMVAVADATGAPIHVSHFSGTAETYATADAAHARGVDITWDAYPYLAGCSMLSFYIPHAVQADGPAAMLRRLADPAVRRQVRDAYTAQLESLRIATFASLTQPHNRPWEGQTFETVWQASGKSLEEFVCDLLIEEDLSALMVYHRHGDLSSAEARLRHTLTHSQQMVGTDGIFVGGKPHPRGYGSYPRILGRYVREAGWLTLEEAIWKMSGYPAQRFSLTDRGLLASGYAADITVFDPNTVLDQATYENARQAPIGIEHVFVNGQAAVSAGQVTGTRAGRVVKPKWA